MATIINADNGSVSGSAGLKQSSDASGVLDLQTNGTTAVTVSTGQDVSFANAISAPNTFGFKNRIINGDMRIDQRAVGVETRGTVTSGATYTVDRWYTIKNGAGQAFTVQKSTDVPSGQIFKNSALITITETDSTISTGEYNVFGQNIEGLNVYDLLWGTANAKAITLSFWVKSSLTGTFAVSVGNQASNVYAASYTINAANTWEYKTVTIPGPTSGTFPTDTTSAIQVRYDLGIGTQYSSALNTWTSGGNYFGGTGAVKLAATNGATWQVTGVQFETGNQATAFDVRPYGTELALCQRYLYKVSSDGTNAPALAMGFANSTTQVFACIYLPVSLRAAPTLTWSGVTVSDLASYTRNATAVSIGAAPATGLNVFRLAATESAFISGGANQLGLTSSVTSNITLSAEI